MPPPLPTQQGSRAGLITALVIFVIFTLVISVFYFQERGLRQLAENEVTATKANFANVAPTDMSDATFTQLKDMAKDKKYGDNVDSAFAVAVHQRDMLIKALTGSTGYSAEDAVKVAEGTINETQQMLRQANIAPADHGMAASQNEPPPLVLRRFTDAFIKANAQRQSAEAAVAAAQTKATAVAGQTKTELETKTAEITKLQGDLAARQADLDALLQKQAAAMQGVNATTSAQLTEADNQVKAAQAQIATLGAQITPLQAEVTRLKNALKPYRMDVRDNMVRRADGVVTRVPGNGIVYINLGSSDGIPVGLTFEVYDKGKGIPSLNADLEGLDDESARRTKDANARVAAAAANAQTGVASAGFTGERLDALPTGSKASIEVISVGPGHTAECRIIGMEPGAIISEGDVIGNVVYNKNVKLKFATYGEFDLDYNGIPTPADTATVRRLISQWGGTLVPLASEQDLGPQMDFVVVGLAPSVPVLSAEDANDPVRMQQVDDAKAALAKYNSVLDKARDYSIPVLNQTRFLYYTGYFDQRTR